MNKIIAVVFSLVATVMLLSEPDAYVTYAYMCIWYLTAILMAGTSYLLWNSKD